MKCRKCGKELKDDVKFCSACGEKVGKTIVEGCKSNGVNAKDINSSSEERGGIGSSDEKGVVAGDNAKNNAVDMKALCMVFIPIFTILFVCFGGYFGYCAVKAIIAERTFNKFEYNAVDLRYDDYSIRISYYDENSPVLMDFTDRVEGIRMSAYCPEDGTDLVCLTESDTFPYPDTKICDRKVVDNFISSMNRFHYSFGSEYYTVKLSESDVETFRKMCESLFSIAYVELRNVGINEIVVKLDKTEALLNFRNDNVSSGIEMELYKVDKSKTFEPIKEKILSHYSSSMLVGEYYQPGTDNKLTILDNELSIDDDLNVHRTVLLNGEEKDVLYDSCYWTEDGCKLEDVEYQMTEECRQEKETQEMIDSLFFLLDGRYWIDLGNSKKELNFTKVYAVGNDVLVDCIVDGDETTFHARNRGSSTDIFEVGGSYGFSMQNNLESDRVAYHLFTYHERIDLWWL